MKPSILRLATGLGLFVALVPAQVTRADDVTVLATRDTTIYEGRDSSSNGKGSYLFAGPNSAGLQRRTLIAFDLAAVVPSGATITRAALTLELTRTQPRSTTLALHRVEADWGEGASRASGEEGGGADAADGDSTWTHRGWPNDTWATPGGDYSFDPSAVTDVSDLGSYVWESEALVSDVQRYIDQPELNHGWILIDATQGSAAAKRFSSRDDAAGVVPQLHVTFEPPSDPTGACCRSDGSCGVSLDPGTSCEGTYLGSGTSCESEPCPAVTGACCTENASASCAEVSRVECGANQWLGPSAVCDPNPCQVVLERFVDPLPRPAPATPIEQTAESDVYQISMRQTQQQLHRDLPPTTVWGFHDSMTGGYPGPTIEARTGRALSVIWENDLRDEHGDLRTSHVLDVDTCLHGAHDDTPRTVVHFHGGHVPSGFDGQPEETLLPGDQTRYEYPNRQRAATLWYHDHAVGITRLNVYMGLAGYYLIRDDEEEALGLPSGKYEVPLAIQDRDFYPDGRLRYPATWQETFFGHNALVNGKVSPFLNVDRGSYRFRLLNGSTSRAYTLSLSNGRAFLQIGSDGGLLPESISMREITLLPGERADVVIDFAYAEAEVILKNSAKSPFPGGGAGPALTDIMKFIVGDEPGHTDPIPLHLSTIAAPDESSAVLSRDLVIRKVDHGHCGGGSMWMINDKDWGEITEYPHLGTSEVWRFINQSGVTHPMHMHMLFFRVLDRQPFRLEDGEVVLQGEASLPARGEVGWKDTVQVGPFEVVRVLAAFEDFPGRFSYHCHLIEHEDHGMMRQFEAVLECGDNAVASGLEECDDGNTRDGDGCDASCKREGPQPPPARQPPKAAPDALCSVSNVGVMPSTHAGLLFLAASMWLLARRRARS